MWGGEVWQLGWYLKDTASDTSTEKEAGSDYSESRIGRGWRRGDGQEGVHWAVRGNKRKTMGERSEGPRRKLESLTPMRNCLGQVL